MKTILNILTIAAVLCVGMTMVHAAEKNSIAGPKGGRLLEKTEPKAEFFVEMDRTVTIAFYDAGLKQVAATTQSVTLIADAKGGKKTIEFEKKGDVLVSQGALPDGEGYSLVVQFKQTVDARSQNFRFKLETHKCGECKRAEYACDCHH
jgi:hypothetical protein